MEKGFFVQHSIFLKFTVNISSSPGGNFNRSPQSSEEDEREEKEEEEEVDKNVWKDQRKDGDPFKDEEVVYNRFNKQIKDHVVE